MSSKMKERRRARESAVSLLYSSDITENDLERIVDEGAYPADDFELPEYAEDLVRGIAGNLDEIDARLASTSQNWAIDRMPAVDRAILRLAVYEMLYVSEVPVSVAINEAVELAKAYGGEDDSARFVNGVLGNIARDYEAGVPLGGAAPEEAPAEEDPAEEDPAGEEPAGEAPAGEAPAEDPASEFPPAEEPPAEEEPPASEGESAVDEELPAAEEPPSNEESAPGELSADEK